MKVSEIDERPHGNAVDKASLKHKRKVETENVVADYLVGVAIKLLHKNEKFAQCLFLFLFIAFRVNAKNVFTLALRKASELHSRYRASMNSNGQNPSRSGAQCAELVAALLFGRDVFQISLLLLQTHVAQPHGALELEANSFAETRKRKRFNVHCKS